jgi:hypothetical protein
VSLRVLVHVIAAGLLTWVASATQPPAAAGAKRGPRVHSEASASSSSAVPASPTALRLQPGAALQVRLNQSIGTARNRAGDRFTATLAEPVRLNGRTVFQKGAQLTGRVEESNPSGRFKGRPRLMVALDSIQVDGRRVPLSTSVSTRTGQRHRKRNAMWIGGGSGAGALIGGLAGGPVGLAVGAGSGAAAGLAGALVTGRKQVTIPAETLLTFRLRQPVSVPLTSEASAQMRRQEF